jgi:hypothetical protein
VQVGNRDFAIDLVFFHRSHPLNRQSDLSGARRDVVENMRASDDDYRERLHRHYETLEAGRR